MELSAKAALDLAEAVESTDERMRTILVCVRNIRRAAREAMAAETEWSRLHEEHMQALDALDSRRVDQTGVRMDLLKTARCLSIKAAASSCRYIVRAVSGDLRIDESTAGTMLPADERRMIWEVLNGEDGI